MPRSSLIPLNLTECGFYSKCWVVLATIFLVFAVTGISSVSPQLLVALQ